MLKKDWYLLRKYVLIFIICVSCLPAFSQVSTNKPTAASQTSAATGEVAILPQDHGGNIKINYVRTWEAMGRYQSANDLPTVGYLNAKEATQYIDGLSRPIQTVIRQASPGAAPKDLVSPVVYDNYGREVLKYLPYVQSNDVTNDGSFRRSPFVDQNFFYKSVYKDATNSVMYAGEDAFYSRTQYEEAPLNRVERSFAPGNSWAGSYNPANPTAEKAVKQLYMVNTAADGVRLWTVSNNTLTYLNNDVSTNIPSSNNVYLAGELYKIVVVDES